MEGVILFADDHVFDFPFEKGLFESLSKEQQHPVLPIMNLELLETSIKSTSSIKAVIVDWNFEYFDSDMEEAGTELLSETPFYKLMSLEIFSLIYIYSDKSGLEYTENGQKLKEKYKEKIFFRTKDKSGDLDEKIVTEKNIILADLLNMSLKIGNIKLAIKWSQVINQSVQRIFSELNDIDNKWISDLYITAEKDGVEPSVEVINIFQNLLAEKVIQSKDLRGTIKNSVVPDSITKPEQYAKLFRTFLYSYLDAYHDPIMTGDIFKFEDGKFGVLITPECDISKVENVFEFLTFSNNKIADFEFLSQFNNSKKTLKTILKTMLDRDLTPAEGKKINISLKDVENILLQQIFNQPHQRLFVLPCFDFGDKNHKTIAQIDFRDNFEITKVDDTIGAERMCKLNSPYIQELRQRFLAYKGRVGVPSFPDNLRSWLLK